MLENYVYKKEVDWSLLMEGFTLPVDNQVVFGQIMGRFLNRGERKQIKVYLDGKSYSAVIYNVNFDSRHNRKKDTYQIRYKKMVSSRVRYRNISQTVFSIFREYEI